MINKISIDDVATFKEKVEFSPNLINYIYGFNGSGKTTLSNVLAAPDKYDKCIIEKNENDKSEMVVYNKKFVDELFSDSSKLKGIFTLGKDSGEALEIISKSKNTIDDLLKENQGLEKNITKKESEKKQYDDELKEECWKIKTKLFNEFSKSLIGYGTSKDKFKLKCLNVTLDKTKLKQYSDLVNNYKLLYDNELQIKSEIEKVNADELYTIEKNNIFQEVIKGSDETTVSELINKLNNSDWVKQGLNYLEKSDNRCPFCQQKLNESITHLAEYFNKEYEEKCNNLVELQSQYNEVSDKLLDKVANISNSYFKDDFDMKLYYEKLESLININKKNIELKINAPSNVLKLNFTEDIVSKINEKIINLNMNIRENNKKLSNINDEKNKFVEDLWNYIVSQLETEISVFNVKTENCDKALNPMKTKLNENNRKILEEKNIIKENEKKITGITESLIEINKILKSFGFDGFKLSEGNIQGTYKIVRQDGTDVGKTLSEGEYRFISFLYFYHLISGSNESSGITRDKILVIDDPISSLDSNSLFIVSTLVKKLISECFESENGIKQIFILTHNVYFYKEIVYRGSRDNKKETKEKYFVLSKKNEVSSIKEYEKNPIETTYQLLWEELKDENINKNTCCNTMRRILEYYFNIIGSKDYEKAIDNFEGTDKIVCKSLISCINDNSHYINEEFNIVFDDDMVQKYKKVFKEIFNKLGHIEHYKMMMNEEDNNG